MARTPPSTPPHGLPQPLERGAAPSQTEAEPVLGKGTRGDVSAAATRALGTPPGDEDVASLVHDIRTPLSVILLEAELLEQRFGTRTTPAAQKGFDRIAQNAAYIDRLVTSILDLCSIESGNLALQIKRVDLARLLGDTIDRAVSTLERGRVSVEIRDVLFVDADEGRLERVIANLLGNALKFSAPGEPVTVRLDSRGDHACVSVIDAGPGLSPEQTRTVFERYQRTGSGRHDGYGLGLHICHRIIELHHGRIGVSSTPGKGSRFYFELRAVPGPRDRSG